MDHLIAEIEGYASVFNIADLNGDVVAPGAFATSLKKKPKPAMLYSHAAEAPIGRWTLVREDSYGLFVKGELILSSPRAREVHALLEGGALNGLSIGYQTLRASRTKTGRRILEADLWEVSVVTFPMAREARVTRVGPARPEFDPAVAAKIFKEPVRVSPSHAAAGTRTARARRRADQASVALAARAQRRADQESAAFAAGRAPAPSSPTEGAGARLFAQTLNAAAQKLSHEKVAVSPRSMSK